MAGMISVFVLHHFREDVDSEDIKFLGVYSSQVSGEAAIARFRKLPGFRQYAAGFSLEPYRVDEDQWTSGFGFDDSAT